MTPPILKTGHSLEFVVTDRSQSDGSGMAVAACRRPNAPGVASEGRGPAKRVSGQRTRASRLSSCRKQVTFSAPSRGLDGRRTFLARDGSKTFICPVQIYQKRDNFDTKIDGFLQMWRVRTCFELRYRRGFPRKLSPLGFERHTFPEGSDSITNSVTSAIEP